MTHDQGLDVQTGQTWCIATCRACDAERQARLKAEAVAGVTCHSQVNQGRWCQETFETASGDAGKRARQLRKAGFRVSVEPMGLQVTKLGLLKLTLVTITPGVHEDTSEIPPVKVDRL